MKTTRQKLRDSLKNIPVICGIFALLFGVSITAKIATAGQIASASDGTGAGTAKVNDLTFPPPMPNNDNVERNPNGFKIVKEFEEIGPLDVTFIVNNLVRGGVTEYRVAERVTNMTGIAWTDFHIELGFGSGEIFEQSPADDGLDFDHPDFDPMFSNNSFPTITMMRDSIWFDDGILAPGDTMELMFQIDVPNMGSSTSYRFTLRQYPTIPEPATLALMGLGLAGIGYQRRRKVSS